MTKRAERVYLSFFEGEGDNAPRLARAIRTAIEEASIGCIDEHSFLDNFEKGLCKICNELEDPTLLDGIYGNCYD